VWFQFPDLRGRAWCPHIDTRTATGFAKDDGKPIEDGYLVTGRSIVVLRQPGAAETG
jgi:hypothetical protein